MGLLIARTDVQLAKIGYQLQHPVLTWCRWIFVFNRWIVQLIYWPSLDETDLFNSNVSPRKAQHLNKWINWIVTDFWQHSLNINSFFIKWHTFVFIPFSRDTLCLCWNSVCQACENLREVIIPWPLKTIQNVCKRHMNWTKIILHQLNVLQNISTLFIHSRRDTDSIFWSGFWWGGCVCLFGVLWLFFWFGLVF